ncbi:hypothetical protein SSX86_029978 [Deinandra increscens subsp. villosa]|uniref:Reverse transcriptase Ty1/copia-type domain-containing protein n=1 Tax=Deinandra increscens subsp. villosa TaxID=3103831 RepID=A0AAP0CG26_9ASTR
MDVKSAFLNGKIREEVYVKQAPGFYDPEFPDKVYKLDKALYGLHQAPRAWYETLSTHLLDNGFQHGKVDCTLFSKKFEKDLLLVQVYVDDIIFGSTKHSLYKEFERVMQTKFEMSSMGEMGFFLGLQVHQSAKGIFLHQSKYVSDVLTRFKIGDVRIPSTPIQVPGCSKASHMLVVKRIFAYLKGNPDLGIWYPNDNKFELSTYSDSDYGGCKINFKSTTAGCQFLGERLVSWQCKKQTSVATSTSEAEYVAASSCCSQVLWIQQQLRDYGLNFLTTPIYIDNSAVISITKNPVQHSKTKHIDIRYHFIRDCYEKKLIDLQKIHTDPSVIRARVHQTDVIISEEDVRRFLRMNDQADFPVVFDEIALVALLRRINCRGQASSVSERKGPENIPPPTKRLIGHLEKPDYVAPANNAVRHEDSSEDELQYYHRGYPVEEDENEEEDQEQLVNQGANVQVPVQQEAQEHVVHDAVNEPEAVNVQDEEMNDDADVSGGDASESSPDTDSDSGDYVTILHNTRGIQVKKGSKQHIEYLKSKNLDTSKYENRTKQVEDKDDDPTYTPALEEPIQKTKTADKGKAPMVSKGKHIKDMAQRNLPVKKSSFLADARKAGLRPPSKKQKVSSPKLVIRKPSSSAASASTIAASITSTILSTDLKLALHQTRHDELKSTNRQQADEIRGLKNLGERRPDPEESCRDDGDMMRYLNEDPDPESGVGGNDSSAGAAGTSSAAAGPSTTAQGESSEKEVYDVTPISRVELKEGEFINPYSKEQMVAIFALNMDDVDKVPFADSYGEETSDVDMDFEEEHVEVEDMTAEEYLDDPKVYGNFSANDQSGGFNFFGNEDEENMDEELKKKESATEKPESNESEKLSEEEEKKMLFDAWLKEQRAKKMLVVKPTKIVDQKKYFDRKGGEGTGGIISWMYDSELKCFSIKKEFGVMYLKHATRFNTLPVCDVRDFSRKPFLNYKSNLLAEVFKNKLKEECQSKFRFLTPQRPKYAEHPTDIHPITRKPVVVLKYKKPIQLKKIPLKKLEQDFIKTLRWWYYDENSGEAVVVVKEQNKVIRLYHPMWLINLSKDDIDKLYHNNILYKAEHAEQALQFQRVIRVCFAFGIHAGNNRTPHWKKTWIEASED